MFENGVAGNVDQLKRGHNCIREVTVENPTFRLEGLIKFKRKPGGFEGALVLILQLISKNKELK